MTPDRAGPSRAGAHRGGAAVSRVAAPGAAFWAVKILTTGMGETTSDFLVRTFAPEVVVPVTLLVLVAVLAAQLRQRRYHPAWYWSTALMISVFGTMAADVLHVGLGVPYAVSTAAFAVALAAVFLLWRAACGTVSVHEVVTLRREGFYWAAVMTTFALGTAAGDLTASSLGLGYLGSAVLFAVLFAVPGLLYAVSRSAPVALFWTAYVLTRPLGASISDFAAVSPARCGLGIGPGPVSAVLLGVFAVAVAGMSVRAARPGVLEQSADAPAG